MNNRWDDRNREYPRREGWDDRRAERRGFGDRSWLDRAVDKASGTAADIRHDSRGDRGVGEYAAGAYPGAVLPIAGGMGTAASTPRTGGFAGRGPRNFRRDDTRILEEVCERLTRDPEVDASDIEVRVEQGVVILSGGVEDRYARRRAEDLAAEVWGVADVHNDLRSYRR